MPPWDTQTYSQHTNNLSENEFGIINEYYQNIANMSVFVCILKFKPYIFLESYEYVQIFSTALLHYYQEKGYCQEATIFIVEPHIKIYLKSSDERLSLQ